MFIADTLEVTGKFKGRANNHLESHQNLTVEPCSLCGIVLINRRSDTQTDTYTFTRD